MDNKDDTRLRIARAIYADAMMFDNWDKAQDHEKYRYYDLAQELLNTIDQAGYALVEKVTEFVEEAKPKPRKKARKGKTDVFGSDDK